MRMGPAPTRPKLAHGNPRARALVPVRLARSGGCAPHRPGGHGPGYDPTVGAPRAPPGRTPSAGHGPVPAEEAKPGSGPGSQADGEAAAVGWLRVCPQAPIAPGLDCA